MKTTERAVCVAVAAVLLGGCHETLTQLEPQLIAPATHPALVFSRSLPELGDIVRGPDQPAGFDGSGAVAETESLVSRWDASWDQGTGEGQALREAIYRAVASGAAELDEAATRSMMDAVRQALIEAGIRARVLPPHLAGPLDDARRYIDEAERAREAGDAAGWALAGLRAADALRETTPRRVALRLLTAAEEAMAGEAAMVASQTAGNPAAQGEESAEDHPAAGGDDAGRLTRADELIRWTRAAIASGDYERAIQRAYYACRLLGAVPE